MTRELGVGGIWNGKYFERCEGGSPEIIEFHSLSSVLPFFLFLF